MRPGLPQDGRLLHVIAVDDRLLDSILLRPPCLSREGWLAMADTPTNSGNEYASQRNSEAHSEKRREEDRRPTVGNIRRIKLVVQHQGEYGSH